MQALRSRSNPAAAQAVKKPEGDKPTNQNPSQKAPTPQQPPSVHQKPPEVTDTKYLLFYKEKVWNLLKNQTENWEPLQRKIKNTKMETIKSDGQ